MARVQLPRGDRLIEFDLDADTLIAALPLELRLELLVRLSQARGVCIGINHNGAPCRAPARPGGILCSHHSVKRGQPVNMPWSKRCSTAKRDGAPCRAPAVNGGDLCHMHLKIKEGRPINQGTPRCTATTEASWSDKARGKNTKPQVHRCGAMAVRGTGRCPMHRMTQEEREAHMARARSGGDRHCAAVGRKGQPCRAVVLTGSDFCRWHGGVKQSRPTKPFVAPSLDAAYGPTEVKAKPTKERANALPGADAPPPLKDDELQRLRRMVGLIK